MTSKIMDHMYIAGIAAILLLAMGVATWVELRPDMAVDTATVATVTGEPRFQRERGRKAEVTFATEDGREVTANVRVGSAKPGELVNVVYEAARPTNAKSRDNVLDDPRTKYAVGVPIALLSVWLQTRRKSGARRY
jgi:hypothetical protein